MNIEKNGKVAVASGKVAVAEVAKPENWKAYLKAQIAHLMALPATSAEEIIIKERGLSDLLQNRYNDSDKKEKAVAENKQWTPSELTAESESAEDLFSKLGKISMESAKAGNFAPLAIFSALKKGATKQELKKALTDASALVK